MTKICRLWIVFGIAVSSAFPVRAAVLYVDNRAPAGGDGRGWGTAFQTVTAGLAAAVSGDQVWVAAGIYVENITLKNGVGLYGGFAGMESQLTQRNYSANPTVLDGKQANSVVRALSGVTATARIDGFTIRNGKSTWGGGIYCDNASPTITNNTITGNTGSSTGGGVSCSSGSFPLIQNNRITGNTAGTLNGGGIYCGDSSPTIVGNSISSNNAYRGGGIYCYSSSASIANNAVVGNRATYGGGIGCESGSPSVHNNTVLGNSAGSGGGLYGWSTAVTVANNRIVGNSAVSGAGVYFASCVAFSTLTNNSIVGNGAGQTGYGAGIYCSGAKLTSANNIIALNASGIYSANSSTLSLRNNCVYSNTAYNYSGLTDPTGNDGNISANPLLADVDSGNIHIQPESPCRDAGDDAVAQSGWLDIDSQPRVQGAHVDIGTDESDGTVWQQGSSRVIRVSPQGSDNQDGSSWVLSKRSVQSAIDEASLSGGEVWVAAGCYFERIVLPPYVYLYGGFAGTEQATVERNWSANPTMLDGEGLGTVVRAQGGNRVGTIDGFVVRNGAAVTGGGISCDDSPLKINNCCVTQNVASQSGGGILCVGSSPTITNTIVAANSSGANGGAIYCSGSSVSITNCTITANSAQDGGAIYCYSTGSPSVSNSIVAFNSSGLYGPRANSFTLRNNCVFGNAVYDYSGVANPTGTAGSISVNPKLANVPYGNVRIQPDSPCKNAGDDAVIQAGWRDMDNQDRIQGPRVDIGADESDGAVWTTGPNVIVRVSPEGDDANDGSSWQLAKRSLQAGIKVASESGGEVWVKAGTYLERITLLPYAYLYAGFSGAESVRDERDWGVHETILDGQQGGSVVTAQAGCHVSAIDGFTIRNGSASMGSGITCSVSSPVIANNTITKNSFAGKGGGIYCSSPAQVISNNRIIQNAAGHGGGIYCTAASSIITGNTIAENSANGEGGGIWYSGSASMVNNNVITQNIAGETGGGIYFYRSSGKCVSNTLVKNSAASAGGIAYISSTMTVVNNIVGFNSSGVSSDSASTVFRHNCVYGNANYNYSGVADPAGVNGNISADPKLADIDYGNLHIQPDSPCRNGGDDASVQPAWMDLDGQARVQGDRVDIGADESDGTVWATGPSVIVRVSPDGDDARDGASWSQAKRTVQAGINAAASLGGEVWVKQGTYPERITVSNHVYLYGGFAGIEADRKDRDWMAHATILDGQQSGSVVSFSTGYRANTIDGFTIRNGKADKGGGIVCRLGSPIIANNIISENSAEQSTGNGGGIFCEYASPAIAGNTICHNAAYAGGGVFSRDSSPTITNNLILDNVAELGGGVGGLSLGRSGSPAIVSNTIARNAAAQGAGVYCSSGSIVVNNAILANTASNFGGGICCWDFTVLTNNTVVANTAGGSGGGIWCSTSPPGRITNGIVAFNSSGIYSPGSTAVLSHNCTYGNGASDYSGMSNPTGTLGNISADPLFVRNPSPGLDNKWGTADDDLGDLRLRADSPCVDAGNNSMVPSGITFDLAGLTRFSNDPVTADCRWAPGSCGTAPVVDIGAYEFRSPIPGDLDGDFDVDSEDLLIFIGCGSGPGVPAATPCTKADLDGDADVDACDFGFLQRYYMPSSSE